MDRSPNVAELKRNQPIMDRSNEPPIKRQHTGSGPRVELRFLIPSKMAGGIIGKGGSNIRRMREEFSAKVSVPDSNGPERVFTLEGDLETLEVILGDLFRTLIEESNAARERDMQPQGAISSSGDIDLRMLVHQSQAGCIIGKGGGKIKELREESKLRALKVYSTLCPGSSDRVVQMVGAPDELLKSVRMISELLESAPPKGQMANYDARNFDEFSSEQYGGWMGPSARAAAYSARQDPVGPVGMPPGAPAFPPAPHMRGPPRPPVGAGMQPAPPYGGGVRPRVGGAMETTQQVSIPDSLTGSIMGRGGQRIKQIRVESGAEIKIDRGEPGQDRIITIRGTQDQIQNAQYLLQMCVKKYSGQY